MNKVVISHTEIASVETRSNEPSRQSIERPRPASYWSKIGLALLVPALPLLCIAALAMRLAMRNQPSETKHHWTAYISTLLVASGLITSAAFAIVMSIAPPPSIGNAGLAELDERTQFPLLPSAEAMNGSTVSQQLKPLIVVVSPATKLWFGKQEGPSAAFGAGALLSADSSGYLFVTARHVISESAKVNVAHAVIAGLSGVWATADVAGVNKGSDLALLWMPRRSGNAEFHQPISSPHDGEAVFVIGHPQGLRYTLSSGMISREQDSIIQITAPVSPGNSGGPVYDEHGSLIGVVSSTMDKTASPNSENLNFAINSDVLLDPSGWEFTSKGRQHFDLLKQSASHS